MLPIHVINLDRSPERLAHVRAALDGFGLAFTRIPAVDRLAVPEATLRAEFGAGALSRAYPATPGDMACSLTHWRLWDRIAGAAAEAAVVLEDDATLAPDFPAFAAAETAALMGQHGMGLLKIEFWPGPQRSRRFPLGAPLGVGPGGTQLFRLRSGFPGSCGYVLTARGAALLRRRFERIGMPVDLFLFSRSAARGFPLLDPGFVSPAPVLHDLAAFGSDIGAERSAPAARTIRRRIRDWRAARAEAAEEAAGRAQRVEMAFAGAG